MKIYERTGRSEMIKSWLDCTKEIDKYSFEVLYITENKFPDKDLIKFLQKKIITSYRTLKFYNFHFGGSASEMQIRQYLREQVIPKNENQIDKNVRQGDWGEILAGLIVTYFQDLVIPINKLQWKFNKDKAVFGTDLIAFNKGAKIDNIHYYEIKTRQRPQNKEGSSPNRNYISILAHNSLLKDEKSPTESIADFLERLYVDRGDFDTATKFKDIVKNPQNYNRKFELFLIVEKSNFDEKILTELNDLPPELEPLNITIVLIDNLKQLVENTWKDIENVLTNKLLGENL